MSGYLGSFIIDDMCTFYANTHTPSTGAAVDADAVPGYRVYEDETGTPILTGTMALLDDANTVGFYSEQITLSAANGFEAGKSYGIRVTLVVGAVTGVQLQTLQIGARVDVRMLGGGVQSLTDLKDFADDGYDPATNKVQGVVLTDTVTTYTGNTPQTGDNFARIGATGSGLTSLATQASVNTLDDFVDTEVASILAAVDTEIAAIKAVTDALPNAGALTSLATQASVTTIDDFLDTEVAAILAAVDTEVAAIKTKTDQMTFTTANKLDATIQAAGDFAQAAADKVWASATRTLSAFSTALAVSVWDVLASAVAVASSIGLQLKTNVDAVMSTLASQASVTTIDDFLDTEIAAIKAVTDLLPNAGALTSLATQASVDTLDNFVDTEVAAILAAVDTEVAAIKAKTDALPIDPADESSLQASIAALNNLSATAVENAVWDATMASHLTGGTTGASLNGAGSAGDPWATPVPGAYGAGTAGAIVGTVPTILAAVDTEVAAIKAQTDLIPASPAAVGSAMTLTSGERDAVAAALLDLVNAIETGLTPRQALRLVAAACAGKASGLATTTAIYRNAVADTVDRITATVDASGNRTVVTTVVT